MSGTPHRRRWKRVPFDGGVGRVSYHADIGGKKYAIYPHWHFWFLVCDGEEVDSYASVSAAMCAARRRERR